MNDYNLKILADVITVTITELHAQSNLRTGFVYVYVITHNIKTGVDHASGSQ